MVKKTKKDNGITLKLDQSIVDALGVNKEADLEFVVVEDVLIVKAKNKQSSEMRERKRKDITSKLLKKYEPVLKKLAKT